MLSSQHFCPNSSVSDMGSPPPGNGAWRRQPWGWPIVSKISCLEDQTPPAPTAPHPQSPLHLKTSMLLQRARGTKPSTQSRLNSL